MRVLRSAALALSCLFASPLLAQELECQPVVDFAIETLASGLFVKQMDPEAAQALIDVIIEENGFPPSGNFPVGLVVVHLPDSMIRAVVGLITEDARVCDLLAVSDLAAANIISLAYGAPSI